MQLPQQPIIHSTADTAQQSSIHLPCFCPPYAVLSCIYTSLQISCCSCCCCFLLLHLSLLPFCELPLLLLLCVRGHGWEEARRHEWLQVGQQQCAHDLWPKSLRQQA